MALKTIERGREQVVNENVISISDQHRWPRILHAYRRSAKSLVVLMPLQRSSGASQKFPSGGSPSFRVADLHRAIAANVMLRAASANVCNVSPFSKWQVTVKIALTQLM